MASEEQDDDVSRLLLLLTDILGDLEILHEGQHWKPETVRSCLKDEQDGGMNLAAQLVIKLDDIAGKTRDKINLPNSWNDFFKECKDYFPPWVSSDEITEKPIIAKLEILVFLASSLQNKMLGLMRKSSLKGDKPGSSSPSSSSTGSKSDSALPIHLPSHLSQEKQDLIRQCYVALKADYDKRRSGMKQRLDILVSNFEDDNKGDEEIIQLKKQVQHMNLHHNNGNSLLKEITQEELLQHFTTPHSAQTSKQDSSSATPKKPVFHLENMLVVDRGGRTDGAASRVVMTEWSTKE